MAAPNIGTRARYAPRAGATVDASHPLAQGLEFCFVPAVSTSQDLARGYVATRSGALPNLFPSQYGIASTKGGNSSFTFAGVPDGPFLGPLTIGWVGFPTALSATTAENVIAYKGAAQTTTLDVPFRLVTATSSLLTLSRGAATDFDSVVIGTVSVNSPVIALASHSGSSANKTAFRSYNGNYSSTTVAYGGPITGTGASLIVGNSYTTNNWRNVLLCAWSRMLSAAEFRMFYADPFCFLKV